MAYWIVSQDNFSTSSDKCQIYWWRRLKWIKLNRWSFPVRPNLSFRHTSCAASIGNPPVKTCGFASRLLRPSPLSLRDISPFYGELPFRQGGHGNCLFKCNPRFFWGWFYNTLLKVKTTRYCAVIKNNYKICKFAIDKRLLVCYNTHTQN